MSENFPRIRFLAIKSVQNSIDNNFATAFAKNI